MQTSRRFLALFVLALAGPMVLAAGDVETIQAIRMESNAAIARHDVAALQSVLDEDFVITISTGDIEHSRDEHGRSFALHFEQYPDVVYIRTPTEITLSEAYPLAIEHGNMGRFQNE